MSSLSFHDEFYFSYDVTQNPESLLIFAAGNGGGVTDVYTYDSCLMLSPAIGKNILAVGASSTGPARATMTGVDGQCIYESYGLTNYTVDGYPYICLFPFWGTPSTSTEQADIDTVALFSSSGPTRDGRIKPELVAPGDQVKRRHDNRKRCCGDRYSSHSASWAMLTIIGSVQS